ncbi:MAG: hypothetical protein QOF09_5123 [Alphaproteobacteria bacterium]|nr:hypothetical protein [Alphaproteobacteria bacterium]
MEPIGHWHFESCPAWLRECKPTWTALALRPLHPSPNTVARSPPRQLAEAHYLRETELDDDLRNYGRDDSSVCQLREISQPLYVAALRRVASGATADDETAAVIQWAIDMLSVDGHLTLKPGTPEWRTRARELAAIQVEVEKRKAERDQGEPDGVPRHPLLKPLDKTTDPLTARIIGPDSAKPLSEILPSFIQERRATEATNYECKVTVRMLDEFLGEARPVFRLTRQDMNAFKRALAETPANYTKRFPEMQLPEAIKANKARSVPFQALNPVTVNDKYLARLHAMLNWCVRNDIIPDNPASGVKIDTVKETEPRRKLFSPATGKDFQ